MVKEIKKFFSFTNILLILILLGGFFVRVLNIDRNLGFYYDQGRDALAIWNLWHNKDLFLIGPTTGIAGIFRAPYYYYLIAPFYLIGNGNPLWPSIFLSFTTVIASYLVYKLLSSSHSTYSGLIGAFLTSFSFNIVMASRWLSNPTPMFVLSVILIWSMYKVSLGNRKYWIWIFAVLGLSIFSFGSAAEIFYLPAVLIFYIWQKGNTPSRKILSMSLFIFFLTLLPLVIFDLRNDFLITNNLIDFFVKDKSFRLVSWNEASEKLKLYVRVFGGLLFHGQEKREMFFAGSALLLMVYWGRELLKIKIFKIMILVFSSMALGLIFFRGNEGNFYDYYLTGYYLIFLSMFSIGLGEIFKKGMLAKVFVLLFLYFFSLNNFSFMSYKISDKSDGPRSIALGNEIDAIEWIKKDLVNTNIEFNLDVYVPPIIPYSYEYISLWKSLKPSSEKEKTVYVIFEGFTDESKGLSDWLKRYEDNSEIFYSQKFGGVTVEKRIRTD